LYQSPRVTSTFEQSTVTRANVSRFTVAKHTNSLVPTMMSGLFYDSPPFVLRPRGAGVSQETLRAKTTIFNALLEVCEFKNEVERFIESQVLDGTGIAKWGWQQEEKIEKKYVRKKAPVRLTLPFGKDREVPTKEGDEFEVQEKKRTIWKPFF